MLDGVVLDWRPGGTRHIPLMVESGKEIEGMNEEEEKQEANDGYWPITRFAMRLAIWTIVFSVIGAIVISFTGFHFSF
jgi:hypothetical protein